MVPSVSAVVSVIHHTARSVDLLKPAAGGARRPGEGAIPPAADWPLAILAMAALKPAHVSSAAEALAALDPEQKLRVEELLLEQLQARKRDRRLQHFVATLAETVRQTVPTISRHVCVLLCVLLILMLGALGYHYSTVLAYPLVAWRSESGYPALDLTLKRYNFKQFNFRCPIFFPDVCKSDFLLLFQRADPCKPFDNCIQAHITCLQLKRHCVTIPPQPQGGNCEPRARRNGRTSASSTRGCAGRRATRRASSRPIHARTAGP